MTYNAYNNAASAGNLTPRMLKGLLLEMAVDQALDILGIMHTHNDFDDYANQSGGVDFQTEDCVIEVKNWSDKTNVDHETLRREVVNRFMDTGDSRKLLIISKLGIFLIDWLKGFHIETLSLSLDVIPSNYSFTVNLLVSKLKPFFQNNTKSSSNSLYGVND
jgi:hypothetical protein